MDEAVAMQVFLLSSSESRILAYFATINDGDEYVAHNQEQQCYKCDDEDSGASEYQSLQSLEQNDRCFYKCPEKYCN